MTALHDHALFLTHKCLDEIYRCNDSAPSYFLPEAYLNGLWIARHRIHLIDGERCINGFRFSALGKGGQLTGLDQLMTLEADRCFDSSPIP